MLFIVVLEGNGQVAKRRLSIRFGHVGDVVAPHRLHEALCRAVALRAAHRGRQWQQAELPGKGAGMMPRVEHVKLSVPK